MNDQVRALLRRVQDTADFGYVTFDSIHATNALGDNALHCVCVWGDLDAARVLVENGIDIHRAGEHGFTPLRVAAEFGHTALVEYLLAAGADAATLDTQEVFDADAAARHAQALARQIVVLEHEVARCEAKRLDR